MHVFLPYIKFKLVLYIWVYADSQSYCDSPTDSQTEEVIAALEKNGVNLVNSAIRGKTKKGKPKMAMRIDIPATTPTKTIAAVTSMLWEDLVNNPKKGGGGDFINKKKIQCAEKMIRGAFVELYRGLGLLKTYRYAYYYLYLLLFSCLDD